LFAAVFLTATKPLRERAPFGGLLSQRFRTVVAGRRCGLPDGLRQRDGDEGGARAWFLALTRARMGSFPSRRLSGAALREQRHPGLVGGTATRVSLWSHEKSPTPPDYRTRGLEALSAS
jgi:hypothetical protein